LRSAFEWGDFWHLSKQRGLVFVKVKTFRKKWISELGQVKKLIETELPDTDFRNLTVLMGQLGTYHYKKKGILLADERKLYNLLIENSYSPYTVYRWLLLERIPDDIRFQLHNNYISQKKAATMSYERKHKRKGVLCVDVKQRGLQLLRGW
jgi:hypothetical protein